MSEVTTDELLKRMERDRGRVLGSARILAGLDPECESLYHETYMHVMFRRGDLDRKTKELMIVAIDAATVYEFGLRSHMENAIALGATRAEILETLETASVAAGWHALSRSLPILDELAPES